MATAQVSAPTYTRYDLHSLGWKAFQDLCLTVLSTQLGQAVQRYSPLNDGGRDGAFTGTWHPVPALQLTGETIVQCKYSNRRDATLTFSSFRHDLKKAKDLWRRHPRENYVLLTNMTVTAEAEERLRENCQSFGYTSFHVFGYDWITSAIRESSRLRTLVPRIYGLGDLSQILDERPYEQTLRLLETERENLRRFVPTKAYRQAVHSLNEHGFVLLLGEPAVGKTAIAATLTLASGDAWKCRAMRLERPSDLRQHWNPEDPKQLFWLDDAFGSMQYEATRAHEWNGVFPWLDSVLRSGARVILTSRNYIYAYAKRDLKQTAFPLVNEAQVVVDVADLSAQEREQILYNHIRFGDQPKRWRRRFKAVFDVVATHEQFRPEIARRLGSRAFTRDLQLSEQRVSSFVANPEVFLRETIEGLSDGDRAALAAIFIRGGTLSSPVEFSVPEARLISRIGGNEHSIGGSLNALDGSFVRFSSIDEPVWTYKHPTIGDAFGTLLAADPELVDLYLAGAPTPKLMAEVTCGPTDYGVKLIVPPSRYDAIIDRLEEFVSSGPGDYWRREDSRDHFLSYRCSEAFLRRFVHRVPAIWTHLSSFGSYLTAVSEVDVLAILNDYGLLPEDIRQNALRIIRRLAVETPDADFLTSKRVRSVLREGEVAEIMSHVHTELLPRLDEMIENWEFNCSSSEDAESYYSTLVDALKAYAQYFSDSGDAAAFDALQVALNRVAQIIADNSTDVEDDEDDEDYYDAEVAPTPPLNDAAPAQPPRRIFDDIDA